MGRNRQSVNIARMYVPAAFSVEDGERLHAFLDAHAFGVLVSCIDGVPFATHVPMLLEPDAGPHGTLVGHVARANPHQRAFDGETPALAVFHGPHAYVSPTWYATAPAVPTWNYTAVHVYGAPRAVEEPRRTRAIVERLVHRFEDARPAPWDGSALPEDFRERMLGGIVAFELPVARMEGKFKLGQNRSAADRTAMHGALSADDDEARALARFIERHDHAE